MRSAEYKGRSRVGRGGEQLEAEEGRGRNVEERLWETRHRGLGVIDFRDFSRFFLSEASVHIS